VLTTDQKGSIAETAIVAAATKLGIGVFKPLTDGERYDLIFDLRPQLVRVQCKWASKRGDVMVMRGYSARRAADGLRKRSYSPDEIDAFAAYCLEVDRCYFIPIETCAGRSTLQLRLTPTKNNQRQLINWASDFEFEARLGRSGAVAQLGERRHGMAEAAGSSPAGSTDSAG
jgi:PD-(D/E)XK endonuclease